MNSSNPSSQTKEATSALSPIEMGQLRQTLYRFLGLLFLYPDEAQLVNAQLATEELLIVRSAWATLDFGPQLQRLLTVLVALNHEVAEQIEEEYNHLFRVKPAAPPTNRFIWTLTVRPEA